MSKLATSEGIRRLILKEYRKPRPLFSVIKHLESAFREALAHENRLSVDNADDRDVQEGEGPDQRANFRMRGVNATNTAYITTTNGTATAITGNDTGIQFLGGENIVLGAPNQGPRRAESDRDQYLSAMDQAIQRASQATRDPFAAVVAALPNLNTIYPDPAERDAVVAAIREEVRFRLGGRMVTPQLVAEAGEIPLLEATAQENP